MKNILPSWSNLVFTQLVSYGVQLGHSISNSLDFCAWMIRGKRQAIFLIDLFKFNYMLRAGLYTLEVAVRGRKPVWFVNLDKTSSLFVKFPALECGEFWSTENWIKGMISNYFTIKKSFLKNSNKSFAVWNRKFFLKNSNFSHWGFTRYTWPRFIFVSNVFKSYGPCHEAHRLGIPALGIVDTNTPHNLVSIAVPGNDESASALIFYNSFISTFVIYTKYSFVNSWYMSCLSENTFTFENWWQHRLAVANRTVRPNSLSVNFDQLRYMISGFASQFLQDNWQTRKLEDIKYIYSKKNTFVSPLSLRFFYSRKLLLLKALTKSWVLASFFIKLLKPGLRKMLRSRKNKKYQSKYSLNKKRGLYYFLMPFRLSERLFYKKISRRLSKIKIDNKAKGFFYRFYSLAALFSFFRSVPVFTSRVTKKINFKSFYHRGGIRFPSYSYENFLAPSSYKRVFPRYTQRRRYKFNASISPVSSLKAPYPTKGFNKSTFQFSSGWFKSLFILRYCSSLGMFINRFTHLMNSKDKSFSQQNELAINNSLNITGLINTVSRRSNSILSYETQYFNTYKPNNFFCVNYPSYGRWFLNGKLRLLYPSREFPSFLGSKLKCFSIKKSSGNSNMLKQVHYNYV